MNRKNQPQQKSLMYRKLLWVGTPLLAVAILIAVILIPKSKPVDPISLSKLASSIEAGSVERVEDTVVSGDLTVTYTDGSTGKAVRDIRTSLLEQLSLLGVQEDKLAGVEFKYSNTASAAANPFALVVLVVVVGSAIFVGIRTNKPDRWGKKNYVAAAVPGVKFKDIAGIDENLQELRDIVTFLKEGDKYAEMGAKMPRGILMVGDPGTGKTLMAKAIAGEACVPFFATSGSEFTEVFVGVGASRMRSLFNKAKKNAPCIVFIDEIDAVGRSRHRSESGAEMEQDQTLNQLLVEMDGFGTSEGIVVLAATNRDDVLDPALTRPGRFDRRVFVNRPDIKGREQILAIHSAGKKIAEDVQLASVAKATPGLVGADLANIINEAAISAVRNGRPEICMCDFEEAIEKSLAGVQRTSHLMSQQEKEIVAYHEAGHAVVMHETELCDPVYKISIIPRGRMGGFTMALPEGESSLISKRKILGRITGLLGGRAAEEIFFQDVTSGASNDLTVATTFAEEMVVRLGMDPQAGLRVYPNYQPTSMFSNLQGSQKSLETIDEAVRSTLDNCYADAKRILEEKRDAVKRLADTLLEVETVDREGFLAIVGSCEDR